MVTVKTKHIQPFMIKWNMKRKLKSNLISKSISFSYSKSIACFACVCLRPDQYHNGLDIFDCTVNDFDDQSMTGDRKKRRGVNQICLYNISSWISPVNRSTSCLFVFQKDYWKKTSWSNQQLVDWIEIFGSKRYANWIFQNPFTFAWVLTNSFVCFQASQKETSTKLEKAEILQLTVEHLKRLNEKSIYWNIWNAWKIFFFHIS